MTNNQDLIELILMIAMIFAIVVVLYLIASTPWAVKLIVYVVVGYFVGWTLLMLLFGR